MRRRGFLKMLGHVALLAALPLQWAAARVLPKKTIEAVRARGYPGRVRKWEVANWPEQGKWAG